MTNIAHKQKPSKNFFLPGQMTVQAEYVGLGRYTNFFVDLQSLLAEVGGDLEVAVTRISEGVFFFGQKHWQQ
jgi:hypothetical protein